MFYSNNIQSRLDAETGKLMSSTNNSQESILKSNNNNFMKWGLISCVAVVLLLLITVLAVTANIFVSLGKLSASQAQVPKNPLTIIEPKVLSPDQSPIIAEVTTKASVQMSDSCTVIENPANQAVTMRKDISLKCKFDQQVECLWLRRSSPVDISHRYSYVTDTDKKSSDDCSINIKTVKEIDLGEWQCVGIFDDQSATYSKPAQLTEIQLQVVINPKNVDTKTGSEVTLNCKFNSLVECVWTRRGEHIEIRGRYSYLTKASEGYRTDCSIEMKDTKIIDEGEWICSSMTDSKSSGVVSKPAFVEIS